MHHHHLPPGPAMTYQPTAATLALVQRLVGRWSGRSAMVRCPVHEDRTPSLSIRQGREAILVHCFAGCAGRDVMRALGDVLGHPVPEAPARMLPIIRTHSPAQRLWAEALPIAGTLAERYLRDVRGIAFIPPDVRYHAACPMGRGPALVRLPALLVGVFATGRLIAVQRLFLDRQTAQRTHRMMLGSSRGGIWPSRFTDSMMRIAEGFETACAYMQVTGREAGTCFGVRNFAAFAIGAGVERVVLLPDNDPEGLHAAQAAVAARQSASVPFGLERCPVAFNDWAEMTRPQAYSSTCGRAHL